MTSEPSPEHRICGRLGDPREQIAPSLRVAAALSARNSSAGALRAAQIMRDEGLEPDPDISFFLIACPADHLAAARLLGEDSCGRDAPESADSGEEGDESADGCSARLRTLNIEVLEDYGEADMARLLREAPEDYYRRYEAGRLKVHGPRLEHDGGEVDRAGGLLK